VLVLGAAGGVWLGETLGQSGQDQEDETEVHVAGECDYDPATGLPIPAPWCIPVAPCPTCTPPPFYAPPTPEPYTGPFKSNPNAVLTTQPVHRVGDAKELGRDDCPEGWQALVSDTTGLSFCFPPEAKVRSPAFDPHVGGWPGNWDELVFASLDAGVTVGVHRIGWTGGEPYEELIRYGESDFDGHPATTYEIRRDDNSAVSAGSLLQEEVGYLVQRPDGVWRILVEVRLDLPGNVPLRESEVGARRLLGEQIALTVILP
jgi:hypothetical protein